jgi:hypothetical protein
MASSPDASEPSGAGDPTRVDPTAGDSLIIDCDTCLVRGPACSDCVVSCLMGGPPEPVQLSRDEAGALDALAASGLVPPLRLVTAADDPLPDIRDD